jgi:hypothetical protein
MDTVKHFTGLNVSAIQKYLAECSIPFRKSPLYDSATESKFVDESLRKSNFCTITDSRLFDLVVVVELMPQISEGDDEYSYVVWQNGSDITHIKYDEGGFFKRHR